MSECRALAEKYFTQRKSCLFPTLSTTNPTWTDMRWDLGWNPGHCAEAMTVEASFYFQLAQIYSIWSTFSFTTKRIGCQLYTNSTVTFISVLCNPLFIDLKSEASSQQPTLPKCDGHVSG